MDNIVIAEPDVIVDIEWLLPNDRNHHTLIASGAYGCPIRFEDEYFDCRIDLSAVGALSPGGSIRAPLKFASPHLIVPRLRVGSRFTLWEEKTIGHGNVVALLRGDV